MFGVIPAWFISTSRFRGRKIYDANLKFLDKLLTPLYRAMAYLAGTIAMKLNLNEFNRKGKNLMNISSNSIL